MKISVIATLAALLAVSSSPFVMHHGCGLSSWPLEALLTLVCAGFSFVAVFNAKKKWLIGGLLIAAPFVSYSSTDAYHHWLHMESFPSWLLDESGKQWRIESKEKKPNQAPEPTPAARRGSS